MQNLLSSNANVVAATTTTVDVVAIVIIIIFKAAAVIVDVFFIANEIDYIHRQIVKGFAALYYHIKGICFITAFFSLSL